MSEMRTFVNNKYDIKFRIGEQFMWDEWKLEIDNNYLSKNLTEQSNIISTKKLLTLVRNEW